jgi:hypothetical protein
MRQDTISITITAELTETFDSMANILSDFKEQEINNRPFPESWTAGQVAHHIILSSAGLPDKHVTVAGRSYDQKVESIRNLFLDFSQKSQAAKFIQPGEGVFKKEVLLTKLKANLAALIVVAQTRDLKALCPGVEVPGFGALTRYEWLKLIVYHTQRHAQQLRNICALIQYQDGGKYRE